MRIYGIYDGDLGSGFRVGLGLKSPSNVFGLFSVFWFCVGLDFGGV